MLTIMTWDGHNINDGANYVAGFSPGAEWGLPVSAARALPRAGAWPVLTGIDRPEATLTFFVVIQNRANLRTLRGQLLAWLSPEDETPKRLVIADDDAGTNARYVLAVCNEVRPLNIGATASPEMFRVTAVIDGDVRWRAVTATTDTWNITASGQTHVVNNPGEDDAYATFSITPTNVKTGGYNYKRYCLVTWRASNAATNYDIRLGVLDTDALVTAGKMQADGDDLRIFVDGVETPRWLVDIDTVNTYIWFKADWLAAPTLELTVSIAGAGSVDSIAVDDETEFNKLPTRGFVRVNNEVFSYSAKDTANLRLTGVEREVWNTAAGAHSAGDDVFWMQHEIVMVYGKATATAPPSGLLNYYEPMFEMDLSDNDTWVYKVFGQTGYARGGAWSRWGNLTVVGEGGVYPQTHRAMGVFSYSEYTVLGAWLESNSSNAYGWYLTNPCGIVNAAWADGKKRAVIVTDFLVHLMYWVRGDSWWTWQATLADPALANTWEAWSEAAAVADWDPADTLALANYFFASDVEVGTVTVSLNTDETPLTAIGGELGNYSLALTLDNETTGEGIVVTMAMAVNETLEIDTDARLVTYLLDNSNQFQAVALDSARLQWLRLAPGNNTLRFTDTGTTAVTLVTTFPARYY